MDELALLAQSVKASATALVHCGGDGKKKEERVQKNNSLLLFPRASSRISGTDPYDWLMMRCLSRTHTRDELGCSANHTQGDRRLDIMVE